MNPGTNHPPSKGSGTHPDLERATAIADTDPQAAITVVTAALANDQQTLTPVQVVDCQVLLTELHGHTGALTAAAAARDRAAEVTSRLDPPDPLRAVVVLAIGADLALRAGDATTLRACFGYMRASGKLPPAVADLNRLVIAGALMAVAEYQHEGCMAALNRIGKLTTLAPEGPLAAMIAAARTAMLDGCQHASPLAPQPTPALPGGVWQPRCDQPDPAAIAARVSWQPGIHHHRPGKPGPPAETDPR